MTPLDPPAAIAAVAYSDIKTAHDGSPNNLFLILRFVAFRLHCAVAMRAAEGLGTATHHLAIWNSPLQDGPLRLSRLCGTAATLCKVAGG